MPICPRMDECAFYSEEVAGMKAGQHALRRAYCSGRPEICFRLRIASEMDVGDRDSCATPWGMDCSIGKRPG